jgi:hypothetical protein
MTATFPRDHETHRPIAGGHRRQGKTKRNWESIRLSQLSWV